jgi:hypothetical protein
MAEFPRECESGNRRTGMDGSFCFFFQKEALSCFIMRIAAVSIAQAVLF